MKIKSILLLLLGVTIIVTIHSCSQQNNNNPAGNYLQFTVGSNNYKAISFGGASLFDDENHYWLDPNGSKRLSGYIDGPGDNMSYDVYLSSDLKKVSSISLCCGANATTVTGFIGTGTCASNNQTLNVNLNITRNDNVSGGIIEGNFSGIVGKNIPCSSTSSISGSFRLKIQ
jgi:hypothetical protein